MRYHSKALTIWLCIMVLIVPLLGVQPERAAAHHNSGVPPERIIVNQSGYGLGMPKRFTAPLAEEGAPFVIKKVGDATELFSGVIEGNVGDFTAFEPEDTGEYVIESEEHQSVPFSIGPYWNEKVSYPPAFNFMVDVRSYVGTHPTGNLAIGWRDGHQFSFELNTLVSWYMSNPSVFEQMDKQISYGGSMEHETPLILPGFAENSRRDAGDPSKVWGQVSDELIGLTMLVPDERDSSRKLPPQEDYVMYTVRANEETEVYALMSMEANWVRGDGWQLTDYNARTDAGTVVRVYKKTYPAGIIDLKRSLTGTGVNYLFNKPVSLVDMPDIVELIRFGAEMLYVMDARHTMTKAQLAYFLYAYPLLEQWISRDMYNKIHDYAFANWTNPDKGSLRWYDNTPHTGNLLQVFTGIGTGKGEFPPGHTIVPNLMMFEVAKREGRSDFTDYFNAAYNQTQWMIENLDWEDPKVTKGQRMSEHMTMTSLAYFLRMYPNQAPPQLPTFIDQWADVIIARSDNMWDFRMYDDEYWTLPSLGEFSRDYWNETGNVSGFPAAAIAAMPYVAPDKQERLLEIAMAHNDQIYGRNPYNRHFSHDATDNFEGVEYGWFVEYQGGAGQLNDARGVLDGSPKGNAYPYNPNSNEGYTEGWTAFNTAWNHSLAYMTSLQTDIQIVDHEGAPQRVLQPGEAYTLQLQAPLNLDYSKVESGQLRVQTSTGATGVIDVVETSVNGRYFTASMIVNSTSGAGSNGEVAAPLDGWFKLSYGYGLFEQTLTYRGNGAEFVREEQTLAHIITPFHQLKASGSTAEYVFHLTNKKTEAENVHVQLELPDGISSSDEQFTVTVPAEGSESATVRLNVADDAAWHAYTIPVKMEYDGGRVLETSLLLNVENFRVAASPSLLAIDNQGAKTLTLVVDSFYEGPVDFEIELILPDSVLTDDPLQTTVTIDGQAVQTFDFRIPEGAQAELTSIQGEIREGNYIIPFEVPVKIRQYEPLFFEDFEGDFAGDWSSTGTWTADSHNGSGVYRSGESGASLAVAGSEDWMDYTVSADMTFHGTYAVGKSAGLIVRYTNSQNYYQIRLNQDSSTPKRMELYKWVNGTATMVAAGEAFPFETDETYEIKARVNGSLIEGYVNDELLLSTLDASHIKGKAGLRTYALGASFDNFRVYREIEIDATNELRIIHVSPEIAELGIHESVGLQVSGTMSDGSVSDLADAEINYNSLDPTIATVDNNGVVTGVSEGNAIISVFVRLNDVILQQSVSILVRDWIELFEDDFESYDPARWTSLNDPWGVVERDGSYVFQNQNPSGKPTQIIYAGNEQWTDYIVETDMLYVGDDLPGRSSGIIFRYQNPQNFYLFRINRGSTTNKSVELYAWKNGSASLLKSGPAFNYSVETWYKLSVEVQGNQIRGYVDNQLVIEHHDASFAAGAIGFRPYNSVNQFDNVRVYGKRIPGTEELASVQATVAREEIEIGDTVTVSVSGRMDDNSTADLTGATIAYASSDPLIATVNEQGVVTGAGAGTVEITVAVTLDGVTRTTTVEIEVHAAATVPPIWPTGQVEVTATSSNTITLTWTAAADATGVTGYRIFQDGTPVTEVGGAELSYEVTGLSPESSYVFTIQAGNAAGLWSVDGPSVTGTTQPITASELASVQATVEREEIAIGDTVKVSVSGRMSDNSIADLTVTTIVYTSSAPAVATVSWEGIVTGVSVGTAEITVAVTLDGVTRSTTFAVEVRAAAAPPIWPLGHAEVTATTANTITLAWTAAADATGVTGYRIFQDGTPITEVGGAELSYEVTGLSPESSYVFTIQAGNAAGLWSVDGPSVTGTTQPASPGGEGAPYWVSGQLTASNIGQRMVILSWTPASDQTTQYKVYRDQTEIAAVASDVTEWHVGGLRPNTSYVFTVQAGNAQDEWSDNSLTTTVRTLAVPPSGGDDVRPTPADVPGSHTDWNTDDAGTAQIEAISDEVTIPASLMDNPDVKTIRVIRDGVQVTIGREELAGAGGDVKLAVELKEEYPTPSTETGFLRGTPLVYEISPQVNGESTAFSMTLQVSLDALEDVDRELLGLYRYDEEREEWIYAGGKLGEDGAEISASLDQPGIYAVMEWNQSFADVPEEHWAHRTLQLLSARHLVQGISSTEFGPQLKTTRAEFTALLVRLLGLADSAEPTTASFADVPEEAWYAQDIATAYKYGLVQGMTPETFAPQSTITREQMAVLLQRALQHLSHPLADGSDIEADETIDQYKDREQFSPWARGAAAHIIKAGIMMGRSSQQFDPQEEVRRDEAAQAIYNLIKASMIGTL